MKRAIGAIIILVLAAVTGCFYSFDVLKNVGFLNKIYASFTAFGGYIGSHLKFLSTLKPETIFILFLIACLLVFYLLYFLVFGLLARHGKRARQKSLAAEEAEDPAPLTSSPLTQPFFKTPDIFVPGNSVSAVQMIDDRELDARFSWQHYVTKGKTIVRAIVTTVLVLLFIAFWSLRFVWAFRMSDSSIGIAFLEPVYKLPFINGMMRGVDSFLNQLFSGIPNSTLGHLINNQPFYLHDLVELVIIALLAFLVIAAYLLIGSAICRACRKARAKRRSAAARAEYLSSHDSRVGNTYIYYGGPYAPAFQPQAASPLPHAPTSSELPIFFEGETTEKILDLPLTKAEALHGEADFVGEDISLIADLDRLEENVDYENQEMRASYIEDIAEGVNEVLPPVSGEAKTVREDLLVGQRAPAPLELNEGILDTVSAADSADGESSQALLPTVDLNSLFTADKLLEEVDSSELAGMIDFDLDGFAVPLALEEACEEVISSDLDQQADAEEIPEVIDRKFSGDDFALLADVTPPTLLVEPGFELIEKEELLPPEIAVSLAASLDDLTFYPPEFDLGEEQKEASIRLEDEDLRFEYLPQEVLIREVTREKMRELSITPLEEEILSHTEPENLRPVPLDDWPMENQDIPDLGALKIYLDGSKAVEFERGDTARFLAPEIYELEDDGEGQFSEESNEAVVTPDNQSGLKPLHEIKKREAPKIVPLAVKTKPDEAEELVPAILPVSGPLHEITSASRAKSIKPVAISGDLKFNLKRFQVETFRGNLTAAEAFQRGVTKVAPVVNPVVKTAARESDIPEWMKQIKKRQAKEQGVAEAQLKQADEISSVWALNAKSNLVDRVNDFSLRRRKKEDKEEDESSSEVKRTTNYKKPTCPIKPVAIKKVAAPSSPEKGQAVKPVPPLAKPISRRPSGELKKPTKPLSIKSAAPLKDPAEVGDKK